MNLKRLEHLIAVAEAGSLAAAARRVFLSQPALTRSIQALEAEAGFPLCERGARGVTLTPAGLMVAERARRILFETSCLARDLVLLQQHEMGSVEFGIGPLPAAIMLPGVLCALNRDWPRLRVRAEVNEGQFLIKALRDEQLEFVVVEQRYVPLTAELKVQRLRGEPAGCFVRPQHPLLTGEVTIERLRHAPFASVPGPAVARERLRELFGCLPGESLNIQIVTNDFHALIQLTSGSDLVLMAPVRAVKGALESGALIQLTIPEGFNLSTKSAIVNLAQRSLSPSAQRAIAAIEAANGPANDASG
ncbi:LysR family transcriptional regulator [Paraburkholderia sp. Tr-20389]|uniref:LysR family transcriptional regulator n=1 Tax=Paraburkholderia sp. Tr-20389 TaxID=2703903 RepID=UPI00197EB1B7|nr:LysR family transcriptional regulator [Paraburkholderia sp. Tr-20389]MBN3755600.1 LysR family transcriptional regulator [Paraburkholderia sp. Tr-20389]